MFSCIIEHGKCSKETQHMILSRIKIREIILTFILLTLVTSFSQKIFAEEINRPENGTQVEDSIQSEDNENDSSEDKTLMIIIQDFL